MVYLFFYVKIRKVKVIKTGLLFSKVIVSSERGDSTSFLCTGEPTTEEELVQWNRYIEFKEKHKNSKRFKVILTTYIYGEGITYLATPCEIAYFTKYEERIFKNSNMKKLKKCRIGC